MVRVRFAPSPTGYLHIGSARTALFKWLFMAWDGEPVFQSKRLDIYRRYAQALMEKGLAYKEGEAIIFKVERECVVHFDDIIRGRIEVSTNQIKDQVLMKSDGTPTYNFACVVDDADMKITHVIRGEDHISNTPKQTLLYEALG